MAKIPKEERFDLSLDLQSGEQGHDRASIALETLARYANCDVADFQSYILLTNFSHYVDTFSEQYNATVHVGSVLKVAHAPTVSVSIIDFKVGAPIAALLIDVLSYISPQAVVMLGLCGGLHPSHQIGDFLLPVAAIRDEGVSQHYMPEQVPSLPAFMVQQFISVELMARNMAFRTGVMHTTGYRMWEFDTHFVESLRQEKATAIDMECSALFTAGFARKVPVGALMLVSDLPLQSGGVKTRNLAGHVFEMYTEPHLNIAMAAVKRMQAGASKAGMNLRRFHF